MITKFQNEILFVCLFLFFYQLTLSMWDSSIGSTLEASIE